MTDKKATSLSSYFKADNSTPESKRVSELAINFLNLSSKDVQIATILDLNLPCYPLFLADRSQYYKNLLTFDISKFKLSLLDKIKYPRALISVWLYLNRITDMITHMSDYGYDIPSLWTNGLSTRELVDIWYWLKTFECDIRDQRIIEWYAHLERIVSIVPPNERVGKEFEEISKTMRPLLDRLNNGLNPANDIKDVRESWSKKKD